jgi:4-hydroxy-tetrahydrodipicolinate synthase
VARKFPHFALSCGWDDQALEFFACGARSWVCAGSNFLPREHIALYEACVLEKNFDKGRRIMSAMLPLMNFLEQGKFVQSIKYGCELIGLKTGPVRAPLRPLNCEEQHPAIEHTDDRRQENRSPAYTIPIVPDCIPMAICSGQAYVGLRP